MSKYEKVNVGKSIYSEIHRYAFNKAAIPMAFNDFFTGRFLEINEAFTKVVGYEKDEVMGRLPSELSIFKNQYLFLNIIETLKEKKELHGIDLEVIDKDGNTLEGQFSAQIFDLGNRKVFFTSMFDMTKSVVAKNRSIRNFRKLNLMIENLADAVWIIDSVGNILDVNIKASYDTGYSKNELLKMNIESLDSTIGEGTFPLIFKKLVEQGFLKYYGKHVCKDKSKIDIEANATTIEIDGEVLSLCTTRDITKKQKFESELIAVQNKLVEQTKFLENNLRLLEKTSERNKAIINVLPDIIFIYNEKGDFIDCQTNDESSLFIDKSEFIGKNMADILPKDVSIKGLECIARTLESGELENFEYFLIINDKTRYFETRMVKSSTNEVVAIVRDITDQKKEQKKIIDLSYKDQLTGLYNRRYLEEYMHTINSKEFLPVALLMIDVNGLKLTNDAFGHLIGDKLLKAIAYRLKKVSPKDSLLFRIGGDEFVVIIRNYNYKQSVKLVDKIHETVEKIELDNIIVSVSIGYKTRELMETPMRDIFIEAENHLYRKKLVESQSMRNQTIQVILKTLNEKNQREKRHSDHVSKLSKKIGEKMGFTLQVVKEIEMAGLLHDIGKIAVREDILNKPEQLTPSEYNEIKKHSESGYQILKSVDKYSSIADDILYHHERMDGKGYPNGLKGEEIPVVSRIIAVADAYEAMVSDRAYRKGKSHDYAISELKRFSGTQFDPEIVNVFLTLFKEND
ncbi:MAG TPA: HD domain-containing phosphohydrolase [Clostridia bacterium]|nr:HD domain-containing phosphohydrolase [Clostridia bacterium]